MDAAQPRQNFFQRAIAGVKEFWWWLKNGCHDIKVAILTKYTRWTDPKLEPYRDRPRTPQSKTSTDGPTNESSDNAPEKVSNEAEEEAENPPTTVASSSEEPKTTFEVVSDAGANQIPAPTTTEEFLDLIRRTPKGVLSGRERHVIATIMNFPNIKVSDIMLPQTAITYVQDDEVLGPLTLDRLYHSGFQHFPVKNYDGRVIGIIHTTALNNLEVKETNRAFEILDPKVCYLRNDYTLNQALAAFIRTNCYFFLVIDRFERIIGMITYEMIVDYILGDTPTDNFEHDTDRRAVAKR